jgi:DNA-binding LacI/PurR family transcriptional regulator
MKRSPDRRKLVVVVIDLAKVSRRDFLSGLFDRCNRRSECNIRIVQEQKEFTSDAVQRWIRDGVDGVIALEDGMPGAEEALTDSGIPVVAVGTRANQNLKQRQNTTCLRIDDERIGEFAASSLAELGSFNSVAFLPQVNRPYGATCEDKVS